MRSMTEALNSPFSTMKSTIPSYCSAIFLIMRIPYPCSSLSPLVEWKSGLVSNISSVTLLETEMNRYISWLKLYYHKNKKQKIVPIVIAAAPKQRKGKYGPTDIDFKRFNQDNKNNCQKLRYITFSPDKMLKFEEVDYKKI